MRATLLLVVVTAAVWAFGPGCQGSAEPPVAQPSLASDAADAAAESPSPSPAPKSPSGQPVDALLIEWKTTGGELTPLDSALRAAAAPMPLIQAATAIVSPDGSLAAVNTEKSLSIFRTNPWEVTTASDRVSVGDNQLAWIPSSERLLSVSYRQWLREIDPGTGEVRQLAQVPYRVGQFALTGDGQTVVVLAYEGTDPFAIDAGLVFLALVDSRTGAGRGTVDLPGVIFGQRKEKAGGQEYYAGYWPALAVSPDGRRAYVAHADSEAVTVVDVDRMAVEQTVALREPRSRWERLAAAAGRLFAGTAHAKGGPAYRREMVVSPDGRWLYVTGTGVRMCGQRACEDEEPAGLWVVDTRTLQVEHHEDGINHIAVSMDARYVAGTGVSFADGKGTIGRGVKLLRTGTWERVFHAEPGTAVRWPAFSRDGERLYVMAEAAGLEYARSHGGRCEEACHRILAIDVATGKAVATRDVFGHWGELVGLGGPAGIR